MTKTLDDLYEEAIAAFRQRQLQRDNTYVADLIEVLWPLGVTGLSRQQVINLLNRSRRNKGLPIPERFEQALQSAFNQHCLESAVFKKRNVPADGLFTSKRNGNSATWLVHRERAKEWLIAKNKTL
ncbi:MAG: hypothetical protein K2X06_17120 [Burkholderiales bacterium]|nr:hypothetical protein [Burkholderiales bacterium]